LDGIRRMQKRGEEDLVVNASMSVGDSLPILFNSSPYILGQTMSDSKNSLFLTIRKL
jgi:hypothetical protein